MKKDVSLTIYYDASCRLCRSEIEAIRQHDVKGRFELVDCSAIGFDDTPFRRDGVTKRAMMDLLHARDSEGNWFVGVDAFELIYRIAGVPSIAYLWGGRLTRPAMSRLYPWIARHRQLISWSGLPILFQLWGKCAARRANKRSQHCTNGKCSI